MTLTNDGQGSGPPQPKQSSIAVSIRQPPPKVKIEAQFEVGEYEVVVLSATDSMALDTWLRAEKYNIPEGAEPMLKPYIESGMFFFVAKVNSKRSSAKMGGRCCRRCGSTMTPTRSSSLCGWAY
jgi:hypothetical protein